MGATAQLSQEERNALNVHLLKHKIYPYSIAINKTLTGAGGNFPTLDASGLVRYTTLTFRPKQAVGIVSLATNFLITPNTVVDTFGLVVSYKSTLTLEDAATAEAFDEGQQVYELKSQGGAINDFQVFYPLDWYLEANAPLFVHVYVGTAAINAANRMLGRITFGTLQTGIQ